MADNLTAYPFASAAPSPAWPTASPVASTTSVPHSGTPSGFWLPVWSGEVLNAYDQYNIFEPLVDTRTIESGTTLRYPITGTVSAKGAWKAGEELEGSTTISDPGYFDISLDQRPMVAHYELDDVALMLTQWEYRSEIARQAGLALANLRDKQVACLIAQAAFTANRAPFGAAVSGANTASGAFGKLNFSTSTNINSGNADFAHLGNTASTADQRTTAALRVIEYIEHFLTHLQEIDADTSGVTLALNPRAFQDIRALGIARAYTDLVGGAGRPLFGGVSEAGGLGMALTNPVAMTDVLDYMGVRIVKTNHIPTVDYHTSSGIAVAGTWADNGTVALSVPTSGNPTSGFSVANGTFTAATGASAEELGDIKYAFPFKYAKVKGLIWQRGAVASIAKMGMKVDSVRDVRRNTNFTVASVMRGGGVLRPELAGVLCDVLGN